MNGVVALSGTDLG